MKAPEVGLRAFHAPVCLAPACAQESLHLALPTPQPSSGHALGRTLTNYLHFHRSHLIQWAHFNRFKKLVEDFITSGEYEGMPILPDDLGT
ncbi:uncharacterized protein CMC5_078180 [Chondromyces crocatus]|uniref:Uncharacterized protein n=1 Tax=Chondromyces crocatus TaxID=52 RepID=A0A0K1ERP9_CHOCO|nr:uncharacterized protein CMC5_078180 [Chondromyces crocatus]